MEIEDAIKIIDELSPRLTDSRKRRIDEVVNSRSKSLIPVVEDIYDTGNINACMRSAEAMGCLNFQLISTTAETAFKKGKRTSSGSQKWLNISKFVSVVDFSSNAKQNGIQIYATTLSPEAENIFDQDFSKPTAIVFGNEHDGVSTDLIKQSDKQIFIPMDGFVESFNISVACALALNIARNNRGSTHADLSDDEKLILTAKYYQKSVPNKK